MGKGEARKASAPKAAGANAREGYESGICFLFSKAADLSHGGNALEKRGCHGRCAPSKD